MGLLKHLIFCMGSFVVVASHLHLFTLRATDVGTPYLLYFHGHNLKTSIIHPHCKFNPVELLFFLSYNQDKLGYQKASLGQLNYSFFGCNQDMHQRKKLKLKTGMKRDDTFLKS